MNTQLKYSPLAKGIPHRITEVLIPEGQNSNAIVMPLVASLSCQKNEGWLTWITHRKPSKQQLELLGVNVDKLRIVHIKENTDSRWMLWEALNKGNSHTVIADSAMLDAEDIIALEEAAEKGGCLGISIKAAAQAL